jgi:uncharacterized damage-inducible protein DinB
LTVPDPTIEAARDILDEALAELRKALDGCSAAELNRRPAGESTNGLAVLATHALASTRSWLALATGAPLPERERDAEFLVVVEDAATFLRTFDTLAAECRRLLTGRDAFDAAAVGTAPWRTHGAEEPVTAAWALLHALAHLREHVGHAQLTRDVVRS